MSVVLDASAILSVVFDEAGSDRVIPLLAGASISAANWCEVITRMIDRESDSAQAHRLLTDLGLSVVPFDRVQAEAAGGLRAATRDAGLSLGDRACLALALTRNERAVTCDRAWAKIADVAGVEIEVVR